MEIGKSWYVFRKEILHSGFVFTSQYTWIKLRAILYIHDEDDGQTRCGRNFSMGYQRQYLHSELGGGLVCLTVLARVDRLSSS